MSNLNTEQDVIMVARQICGYLINHPKAADSMEGIVSWWLNSRQSLPRLEIVRDALDLLESKGLIVSRILPDGNAIYMATQDADSGRTRARL